MNKRQQQVMRMLKPKVKAFGFNQKELKSVAAKIADNLKSEEDASDEDVNAEIETAIEAVLPALEIGRSYANRVINERMNDEGDNDDDDNDDNGQQSASNKPSKNKGKNSSEMPDWAKVLIESNNSLKSELAAIRGEKLTDTRRVKLEKLLKDSGTFGTRTLKNFSKMNFKDDEEFDEFFTDIEEDLKSFNQERADAGLGKLGAPTNGGAKYEKEETEVLSDDEIKDLAHL